LELFRLSGAGAHVAQSVEHFLGKEEVTGSNPVVGFPNFYEADQNAGHITQNAELTIMRDLISLSCDTCKSRNYTTSKNKKTQTDKFSIKKFCPKCRSHTLHREGKIS
jgi:large subunit ribosomal protein L33